MDSTFQASTSSGLEGRKEVARSARQRVHLWRAREAQRCAENQVHLLGMRASRVNAANTSRLAFDGSGVVYRGAKGLDRAVADGVLAREERASFDKRVKGRAVTSWRTCLFPTGKRYDADLNAASDRALALRKTRSPVHSSSGKHANSFV